MCQQGGQFRLFQIADGELFAVVLPEYKTRERALLGERNEHSGKSCALVEMRKILLQIRIGDLGAQTRHFLCIDRKPRACASQETSIGEKRAPLAPAIDAVLRNRTRQNIERVQGNTRICCVQAAEIRGERIDVLCRDMCLACGEEPS